jgi:hypothetical protein
LPRRANKETGDPSPDRRLDPRRQGPQTIAAILPPITRPAFRHTPAGFFQILNAWTEIIGSTLAQQTTPRSFVQGTLTIACTSPVAMELQHLSGEVLGRVNGYVGKPILRRLRFIQTTMAMLTKPQAAAEPRAVRQIRGMADGPLKDALTSLGSALYR